MAMTFELSEPTAETAGVTLDEAKAWARIDDDYEDALLQVCVVAGTKMAEQSMQREAVKRNDPQALAADTASVPQSVKAWICAYATSMYEHRGIAEPQALSEMKHMSGLLAPYTLPGRAPDSAFEAQ